MATKVHAHIDQISSAERIPASGNYNIPISDTMHRHFTFFGNDSTPIDPSTIQISIPVATASGQQITIENNTRKYTAFGTPTTLGHDLRIVNPQSAFLYTIGVDEEKTFIADGVNGSPIATFRAVDTTATDVGAIPTKFTFEPTIQIAESPVYLPNRRYSNFNFQWSGSNGGSRTIYLPSFDNRQGDTLRLNPPVLQIGQTGVVKIAQVGFNPESTVITWPGGAENKTIQVKRNNSNWELDFTVYEHKSRHAIGGQDALTPADIGAIPSTEKGALSGVATLDGSGKIPSNQLPNNINAEIQNVVHTTGTQTISGQKTFVDVFQVGTGDISLYVSENGNVGIKNNNPQFALDISGLANFSQRPSVNGTGLLLSGEAASLISGKVPSAQLPDYVDDVIDYPSYDSLTGSNPAMSGKIFITIDSNKLYRWNGVTYTQIGGIGSVLSVNSQTGIIVLGPADVGAVSINGNDTISGIKNFVQLPTISGSGLAIRDQVVALTGYQTISGVKEFTSGIRVGSPTDPTVFYVSQSGIGVNTETPTAALDVSGSSKFTQRPFVNGTGVLLSGEAGNIISVNSKTGIVRLVASDVSGISISGDQNISGTLTSSLVNGTINVPLGFATMAYVRNIDTQLNKGDAVYIAGAQGDRVSVLKASNTGENTSSKTFGLAAHVIPNNADGYVITNGQLQNLNILTGFNNGDALWLGSGNGNLTNIKPQAPQHAVFLGIVERPSNGNNGIMYVKVQNGYEIDELHDVKITSQQNNDLLVSENGLWVNKPIGSTSNLLATSSSNGLMQSTDKTKIDSLFSTSFKNQTFIIKRFASFGNSGFTDPGGTAVGNATISGPSSVPGSLNSYGFYILPNEFFEWDPAQWFGINNWFRMKMYFQMGSITNNGIWVHVRRRNISTNQHRVIPSSLNYYNINNGFGQNAQVAIEPTELIQVSDWSGQPARERLEIWLASYSGTNSAWIDTITIKVEEA